MIVRCPACRRGYRLEDKPSTRGRTLRCSACGHLFGREASAPKDPPPAAPAATQHPEPEPSPKAEAGQGGGAGPRVVLADAERPFRSVVKPLLDELGCRVELATQGMDAFRLAVARRPELLIASVHLAGLSGVAICEGVKGSPHLRNIKVALVGSALSADLFNRDTALAYGADLFLEEEMSPEALRRGIACLLGQERTSGGADPVPRSGEPGPDPPDDGSGPEAEISMLARLMLSDLRLYYPERYEQAVRDGKLFETFSDELSRGRAMLDERFPQVAERQKILAAALRNGIESSSSGTQTG